MDKKTELKITGLFRAEFERAKLSEFKSWMCQLIVAITALLSVLVSSEPIVYLATVIALIAAFIEKWFSYQSKRQKDTAESTRRLLLKVNGLGFPISQKELTDLLVGFSVSEIKGRKWENKEYYLSPHKIGFTRFTHLLQESAFFSKYLFAESAKLCWALFGIIFLISLATLFTLPLLSSPTWSIGIAKIISVILMFLISVDFFGRALEYTDAAHSVRRIDDKLEHIGNMSMSEQAILLIEGDYNATVAGAPLIPTIIYNQNKVRLTELWKKRLTLSEKR
jgi:hypothetical protein